MITRRHFLGASTALIGGLAVVAVTGCAGSAETAGVAANDVADTQPTTPTQGSLDAATEPTLAPAAQAAPASAANQNTTANVSCPFRLVDDPYPGRCRRYRDRDGNGYCDYSQSA